MSAKLVSWLRERSGIESPDGVYHPCSVTVGRGVVVARIGIGAGPWLVASAARTLEVLHDEHTGRANPR
jgi:hypothetical protein